MENNPSDNESAFGLMATQLSRFNDLVMAVLIIMILALIVLPLPVIIIDTMIAINICCAVTLLMLSLYIPSSLSLSTFPTLLLITTLFRLSLNITTTRLILMTGRGGMIIETFGQLVVGGNYAVGGVIFLIITIIQFLVIAKGSERVAEVSARFTLDAMPGKQMSIDADMRAGTIDMAEAKKRRSDLENESKLYGAMDGAMKFVKGDTIAGLIITVVNLLGGIAIGSFQRGLSIGEAAMKYSIMTIGDGLVSQIPALMISITSGIIVTRVDVSMSTKHLAGEIGKQVITQPKALAVSGAIIGIMCLVPGFPKLQFFLLGIVVVGIGGALFLVKRQTESTQEKKDLEERESSLEEAEQAMGMVYPLVVNLSGVICDTIDEQAMGAILNELNRSFANDTGIPGPGIQIKYEGSLPDDQYYILIYDVPTYKGYVSPFWLLADTEPQVLDDIGIDYEWGKPFLPDKNSLWVKAEQSEALIQQEIPIMDSMQVICYHLKYVLYKHGHEFLSLAQVQNIMVQMQKNFEQLTSQVQNTIPSQILTDILQRLAREDVSIRNMAMIFESLLEWYQIESQPAILAEYARIKLKRYISYKYSDLEGKIYALMLSKDLERMLQNSVRKSIKGSSFDMPLSELENFMSQIETFWNDEQYEDTELVIVTTYDIRRIIRKTIEKEFPDLPVLSIEELSSDVIIETVGTLECMSESLAISSQGELADMSEMGYNDREDWVYNDEK